MSVLVAYGTKHGSTREIAEHIGSALREDGHETVVAAAREVDDPAGYDAVVLGSAVYAGRWRKDALKLLKRIAAGQPVWLFSSGPTGDDEPDPANKWHHPNKARAAGERLGARDQVVFGGRLPPDPGKRDARDFDAIDAWARRIGAELRS